MTAKKPYIDFTFTGVENFSGTLDKAMISYCIMSQSETEKLYSLEPGIFNKENDTITMGYCTKNDKTLFFLEFGMMIAPSICSHIVFIFDHKPAIDEMIIAARDLENLTVDNLKKKHGNEIADIDVIDNISDAGTLH
ncbi:MAG: hypothetical protein CVV44_23120 [Spirochaetae bacterium HGW-Spirochaetae-1]|jgi:hypothetical protein|nr:MAG: hypothetical protein CVV44_23120 [Spirochaetae bacterium HGW-Spirochaetae-1]